MYKFRDYYGNEVKLSFEDHLFSEHPKHVLVICRFQEEWLLTKHKTRGLEFPGGKVEAGETPKLAAIREVKEETGGLADSVVYVGQYLVSGKEKSVVKNVYFSQIKELIPQKTYYETNGPVLFKKLPKYIKKDPSFSFIMKDDVIVHSINYLKQMEMIPLI